MKTEHTEAKTLPAPALALAACSLPVSLVEDVATLMTDCAPQVTQWQAQWLVALAAELRAHAAAASKRQPAENVNDEPRP